MRRTDKENTDPTALAEVLDTVTWGTLGLVAQEGLPMLVPVNFVRYEDRICIHSSVSGEKMDTIGSHAQATFLVVDPLAYIPSYASDPTRACPATQFFRSVLLYGEVVRVEEPVRKAEILQALMRKLQPEGGHEPITAQDPGYRASLAGVAVLEMTVARQSGKFALGQMFSEDRRASVVTLLKERGQPRDLETLEAMARFGAAR
jgi:nitroimidazol reductase NimA-like FMN-containing flavoprotein (pyridoxamine 5'-phosphate oxidase superfamily)